MGRMSEVDEVVALNEISFANWDDDETEDRSVRELLRSLLPPQGLPAKACGHGFR